MAKLQSQNLRFKFYHQLETLYHQCLNELAEAELTDIETGKLAQIVMLSRQEALKHLVEEGEMDEYYQQYPQDK